MISGNAGEGVEHLRRGATGNVVAGNEIGTNAAGTAAVANYAGVEIDSGATGNLIGTNGAGVNDAAERNILTATFCWCLDDRYGDGQQRRRRQLHRHDCDG